MPKRLIHSVAIAEFDELKGNTLSYVYPENPSPVIKSHQREDIAELCLPDGGHKRSSDCIYILLTAERNVPLYGFAYFRNRESAAEKRGAKQLAILVISTSPYFDRFKPFLSVAVEEYLDHHQSKAIVHQLYGALEKSYRRTRRLAVSRHKSYDSLDLVLQSSDDDIEGTQDESDSRPPAPMIAKQKARPASARLALRGRPSSYDPKSTFGAARDAEPTNFMTHSSVSVQDSNGSEAAGSGSDNDMGGSSDGDDDAREDAHSETGSQAAAPVDDLVNRNSVCFAKLKSDTQGRGVQDHLGLLSSSCTYTMHLWGRMFVMQPLSRLQSNEFGGVSLKEVVLKFRVQTMALWSALVGLRRVLVCGPESQAGTVGGLVLATPLLLGPLGALIIPNLVPYATLANVDPLTKHSSYVCGTTNGLFATKEDWYDLVIDPKDGKLVMSSTSPMDRNLLKVQGGDLAFITRILDGIENGKREEDWVRFEFSTFTQDFLDSVREVELERQTRKLKEEGASTASSASLSPIHGHSASDASSLATMGLLDGIADVEGSRSRLRSVSMWRQKTKTSFLKRKGPRSASEKLAKTFAGSPLWLRYRWIQLNPESYTSSRKHLSRVHVVTVLADPLHAAKLEPKPSVALENQNVLQKREIQDDEDEERQAELPLLKPVAKQENLPAPTAELPPQLPKRPKGWKGLPGEGPPRPPGMPLALQPTKQSPKASGRLGIRGGTSGGSASPVSAGTSSSLSFFRSRQRAGPSSASKRSPPSKAAAKDLKNLAQACVLQRGSLRAVPQGTSPSSPKSCRSAGDPADGPNDDFGSMSGRSFSSEDSTSRVDRTALYFEEIDDTQPPPPLPAASAANRSGNKWRTALTPDGRVYLWNVDTKETKWPSQLEDEEEEGNGGDDDVDSNVDEDTGHETSENPQERQQKRKSRLQQARTAPMVPLRRSPSSQDQAYRSWSANRRSLNSEEYGSDDEDEVDDEDPSGASKWVLLKGRWQRVTVLMQEDIALKVFRKSDWVEAFTEGGERFWHNLKSGESTWEQPPRTVSTIVA